MSKFKDKLESVTYGGGSFHFCLDAFVVSYFPFVTLNETRVDLAKLVFSNTLRKPIPSFLYGYASGHSGWFPRSIGLESDAYLGRYNSFLSEGVRQHQKFPAVNGQMLKIEQLFRNTPANIDLGGKYLPIIDLDCEIHSDWDRWLKFRTVLTLEDYLQILTGVSNDPDIDNKERIALVYHGMLNNCYLNSDDSIMKLRNWCENNKLLSTDGNFYKPDELAYMRVHGFEGNKEVYVGDLSEKQISLLLNAFGINILTEDSISFEIIGEETTDEYLYSRLNERISYIAALRMQSSPSDYDFSECYTSTKVIAQSLTFINCAGINLSHSNFKKTVSTYSRDGKFYYSGRLNMAKLEAIIQSLCYEFEIDNKRKELLVALLDNIEDVQQFFHEHGYAIPDVEDPLPTTTNSLDGNFLGAEFDNGVDLLKRYEYSEEAKLLVQDRLVSEGFQFTQGIGRFSVINGVFKDGVEYPIVVKSCTSWEHTLKINPVEWSALFKKNSMLWVHFGHGRIEPINVHEIFAYHDHLTLSFGTINLSDRSKVYKIVELMRYLNDVHLNLRCLIPEKTRGRSLDEYLFNTNNTIDDLNAVNESFLS